MSEEAAAPATPSAEPTAPNFREQTLRRLQTENEPDTRPPDAPVVESEAVHDDGPYPGDPSDDPVEELAELPEDQVEEDETDPQNPDEEHVDVDEDDGSYKQRFLDVQAELKREQAGKREREEGFRTRTEALAKATHEIEDSMQGVEQAAQFYANVAERGVQQFDSVNWQELQTRPEEYQAAQRQFQAAMQYRDQMNNALAAVTKTHKEQREQLKDREAEVSRDILKSMIPDWGNELYGTLRDHAVSNLHFSAEEVNDITDWRFMQMIYRDYERSQARERVTQVKRKKQARPQGNRNQPQPRHRNAQGRFQSARQAAFDNPGDRGAIRESFAAKLRAEREGR